MSGSTVGQVGRLLGDRYELLAVIGSGGSAEVYHATDTRLGRSVAIKQLRAGYADDARFLKLFRAEATLAAQLAHPNIMTVFDWSDDADGSDGGPYLVTQFLRGGTLRSVLLQASEPKSSTSRGEPGRLSASQVGFIGLQAAQGLAHAHEQGLVHRDIKPANLLFGHDGRVHIGDFGIARAVAEAAWTEPEGVLIGTARYAAPEQATDAQIEGVADIYSLTLCLVEALTGTIPLVRENALGTMVQRQTTDVESSPEWGPLSEVLASGGRADPSQRATSSEFLEGLLRACHDLPDPAPLKLLDLTDHPQPRREAVAVESALRVDDSPTSDSTAPGAADADVDIDADRGTVVRDFDEQAPERPPRRMARRLALLALVLMGVAGAIVGGFFLAESRSDVVAIEVGFPTFEVGDYGSMTADEVAREVEALGWAVRTVESYRDGTEVGDLLSQSPAVGITLEPGSEQVIELEYSLGPELRAVPELVGLSLEAATVASEEALLAVGEVGETHHERVAAGIVLAATIGGEEALVGSEHVTGTAIDFVVSSGPAPRRVPDLATLTPAQARAALEKVGLTYAEESKSSTSVKEGDIISQSPAADKFLARGSAVTIVVSTGLPFVKIPAVKGMTTAAASTALVDAGFRLAGVTGSPLDPVSATDPAIGKSVRLGTVVTIITEPG